MAALTSVPILLLTGFLGSGKTSLLARWLGAAEFFGAMVIVNELGEVGIDDRLVESSSEAPLLLENGCVCCAAGEDLTATLERLFWDRLHRKIPKFSWVLIETTGIGDPGPILERLSQHALVAERYHVAGVVTTFDARHGVQQLARHVECANQIAWARTVILTKTDIASEAEIAAARAAIASVRADVIVLTSSNADVAAGAVLAALAKGGDAQRHPAHLDVVHSRNVTTAFAALPEVVEDTALEDVLLRVMKDFEGRLLRLKGLVRVRPDGNWCSVQAMPGEGIAFSPLATPRGETQAGLTIIAQNLPAHAIAKAITARMSDAARARTLKMTV